MSPRATARLQFHRAFTFTDARKLVPYFAGLGVSHLYASPIAAARPGSMHGYDVMDPSRSIRNSAARPHFVSWWRICPRRALA